MMRAWMGLCLGMFVLAGCSSDASTDAGTDSGASADSGGNKDSGGMDSAGNDTGVMDAGLHGCTTYDDRSGPQAMRTIAWQFNPSPRCMEIGAGQSVTWQGDFGFHPLDASGGTMPTPIKLTSNGNSVTFMFPTAGFYGYRCTAHSGLEGVVHVK